MKFFDQTNELMLMYKLAAIKQFHRETAIRSLNNEKNIDFLDDPRDISSWTKMCGSQTHYLMYMDLPNHFSDEELDREASSRYSLAFKNGKLTALSRAALLLSKKKEDLPEDSFQRRLILTNMNNQNIYNVKLPKLSCYLKDSNNIQPELCMYASWEMMKKTDAEWIISLDNDLYSEILLRIRDQGLYQVDFIINDILNNKKPIYHKFEGAKNDFWQSQYEINNERIFQVA